MLAGQTTADRQSIKAMQKCGNLCTLAGKWWASNCIGSADAAAAWYWPACTVAVLQRCLHKQQCQAILLMQLGMVRATELGTTLRCVRGLPDVGKSSSYGYHNCRCGVSAHKALIDLRLS